MENEPKKNSSSAFKIILIILIVIAVIFGLYFGLAWILRVANNKIEATASPSATQSSSTTAKTGKIDEALVGTWTTDCLVPDSESPWSEKHQFTFNKNGTATHIRWSSSGHECSPETTLTDNYQYSIPAAGQIDLKDTEKSATIYDIYQISGSTLKFGHGFCNCSKLCSSSGGASAADRFTCLNDFLIYKK